MNRRPPVAAYLLGGFAGLTLAAQALGQWQVPTASPSGSTTTPPSAAPTYGAPGQPYPYGSPTTTGSAPTAAAPASSPAPSATTDPYGRPVSAGGLNAPPPMASSAPPPPSAGPAAALDEAEEDDSGRGLTWFWLDVEGGFQYVALETFSVDTEALSAGFESSDASGGYVGAGLGAQLIFIRIGPRFRVGFYPEWQIYSINGELGFRIPIGIVEPHIDLGAGYSALGSLGGLLASTPDSVQIDGFNVRAGGGIDFFPTPILSLGATFTWELMGLTRPGVDASYIASIQNDPTATSEEKAQAEALKAEGSGYGQAFTIGARLGLNF
jgi:hypothetical protein